MRARLGPKVVGRWPRRRRRVRLDRQGSVVVRSLVPGVLDPGELGSEVARRLGRVVDLEGLMVDPAPICVGPGLGESTVSARPHEIPAPDPTGRPAWGSIWVAREAVHLRVLPEPLARSLPERARVRSRIEPLLVEVQLAAGDALVVRDGALLGGVRPDGLVHVALRSGSAAPPSRAPVAGPVVGASPLAEEGYDLVSLLDGDAVAVAQRGFDALGLDEGHGFFISRRDLDAERAIATDRSLADLVGDRVREVFPGYRRVFATYCSKGRLSDNVVNFHHDPMFTDERRFRTLLVWCSLVDCEEGSGALKVVAGSHRWTDHIRPSESWDVHRVEGLADALDEISVAHPLWAGDAIVLDGATVHGSGPNLLDATRAAIVLLLVPDDAPLLVFERDDAGSITGRSIDASFFFSKDPSADDPLVEPWTETITSADIERGLLTSGAERAPR